MSKVSVPSRQEKHPPTMNSTATQTSEGTQTDAFYIDDDLALRIMRILMYGATPAVSVFGVIGNSLSMAILVRHGLGKSSNIILFSLACTDLVFLVTFNSVPKIIYDVGSDTKGFHFANPHISFFMFILYVVAHILDYGMGYISLTIPVLITLERLVAVQFPLAFRTIVTPARTWSAVGGVYFFWYGLVGYCHIGYEFMLTNNGTLGLYYQDTTAHPIVLDSIVYLAMRVPPLFTFSGCVYIAIKVKIASTKRMKMTNAGSNSKEQKDGNASFQRTTRMLLAVCALYTVTCVVLSTPSYLPVLASFTTETDEPSNVQAIGYQVINIMLCINSSFNFLIYIVMNKNFRDTFKTLFPCKKCK